MATNFTLPTKEQFDDVIDQLELIASGSGLKPATATTLGGIKVGNNLNITVDGTLSAESTQIPVATASVLGGIKVGTNLSATTEGVLSATDTTYSEATTSTSGLMSSADKTKLDGIEAEANKYILPTASSSDLGGVKVGSNLAIDANGVLTANISDTTEANMTENVSNLGTITANTTLNADNYSNFVLTLGANLTLTPSLTKTGTKAITIIISGGNTYSVTWGGTVKWADGTAPDLSSLAMVTLFTTDKTTWYGSSVVGLA